MMLKKIKRKTKFLLLKLLRIKDKEHSIALGFSIGLIVNFIPSFGLGPILSTACAKLFRGNPLAGFVGGVSVIWLFPLFFYLNLVVGHVFLPIDIHEVADGLESSGEALNLGVQIGRAFFIGMGINILFFGTLTYIMSYTIIKKYRSSLLQFIFHKWKF